MQAQQFKIWLKENFDMNEKDCQHFEPFLKIKKLDKKDQYLKTGQVCSNMAFVNKGAFRLFYNKDGVEINNYFFLENEFVVSFSSFINQTPSLYTIEALEESEIVYFDYDVVTNSYDKSHKWERFGRIMAERSFQVTIDRVEDFQFRNAEQRYLKLLEQRPEWFQRIPLYHIASFLGIKRESLSRLRKSVVLK